MKIHQIFFWFLSRSQNRSVFLLSLGIRRNAYAVVAFKCIRSLLLYMIVVRQVSFVLTQTIFGPTNTLVNGTYGTDCSYWCIGLSFVVFFSRLLSSSLSCYFSYSFFVSAVLSLVFSIFQYICVCMCCMCLISEWQIFLVSLCFSFSRSRCFYTVCVQL